MSIMCAFAYKTACNKKSIKQEKHKKNKKGMKQDQKHTSLKVHFILRAEYKTTATIISFLKR